jgi:hypothetical protein
MPVLAPGAAIAGDAKPERPPCRSRGAQEAALSARPQNKMNEPLRKEES